MAFGGCKQGTTTTFVFELLGYECSAVARRTAAPFVSLKLRSAPSPALQGGRKGDIRRFTSVGEILCPGLIGSDCFVFCTKAANPQKLVRSTAVYGEQKPLLISL